jgi:hypothetical protein
MLQALQAQSKKDWSLKDDGTYEYGGRYSTTDDPHFTHEGEYEIVRNVIILYAREGTSHFKFGYTLQGDKLIGVGDSRVYVKRPDL